MITEMARANSKADGETWPVAKRIYRFLCNKRVKSEILYEGLYQIGQGVVEQESPAYLVVAVDPVNFEKPYAEAIEGVSVVHKATPRDWMAKHGWHMAIQRLPRRWSTHKYL